MLRNKCLRSRRNLIIVMIMLTVACTIYYVNFSKNFSGETLERDLEYTRRYLEEKLEEALKEDKGTGCQIPKLDPFAAEVTQFDKKMPDVVCDGQDWIECYLCTCRVVEKILSTTKNIKCMYQDIIHNSDAEYVIGHPTSVHGDESYILEASDHVKVSCTGQRIGNVSTEWVGYAAGYRKVAALDSEPNDADGHPINVLIFGFDSTSKNGFIRKMPKSYEYITKQLNATVLNGYNIVGDGTPAALFPILTGKTELELPDTRKVMNRKTMDDFPFIFQKVKKLGYRTAFFEDMPKIGTFQYRFNGFKRQPADHYLWSFFVEEAKYIPKAGNPYCVGDTPRYQLMMNLTEQLLKLPGSKFGFTFIVEMSHDNFNLLSTTDTATEQFLKSLNTAGHLENTLLFIMADHGSRFAGVRETLQGKIEERLPFMAIHLPRTLTEKRPDIVKNLAANVDALTTPHDIHATILDALQMEEQMNPHKIKGADLNRALSLLEPIPRSRSCSEAGIDAHWCACVTWQTVTDQDLYKRSANAFVQFVNALTDSVRYKCERRSLTSIDWVMVQAANSRLLAFDGAKDQDGYIGSFNAKTKRTKDKYQIKVTLGPGQAVYEATAMYIIAEDTFQFDSREISRINAYNDEPSCISKTHPHLNMYCYCKDYQ